MILLTNRTYLFELMEMASAFSLAQAVRIAKRRSDTSQMLLHIPHQVNRATHSSDIISMKFNAGLKNEPSLHE